VTTHQIGDKVFESTEEFMAYFDSLSSSTLKAMVQAAAEDRVSRWGYTKTLSEDEQAAMVGRMVEEDDNLWMDAAVVLPVVREMVARELELFAEKVRASGEAAADGLTTCSNGHNRAVVEVYRQAANIARAGVDYRNPNCNNCNDTRGGAEGHTTEQCTWRPLVSFEEHDSCIGQDLDEVGWMGPLGFTPGSMEKLPQRWTPVYIWRRCP
jgi:ketosteroid isomerase-like protein